MDDRDQSAAIALLNSRLPPRQHLELDDVGPAGPLRVYQASIYEYQVLIRGGDHRFDNVVDARLTVVNPND